MVESPAEPEDGVMLRRTAHMFVWMVMASAVMVPPQAAASASSNESARLIDINPISILESAGSAIRGSGMGDFAGRSAAGGDSASSADNSASIAQSSSTPLSTELNILLLLTALSLAPALLILCTCFTRMVIVLGLLRQALGTQGLPPSQVIVGLSLFLTLVVMAPTAERMYQHGLAPYMRGEVTDHTVAWENTRQPLRDFMFAQIEATGNWSGVYMMLNYRGIDTSDPEKLTRGDVDMLSLVPAYILSELKTAFLIGFRMYLPFLVIDMVISSMLISMGMLMLPPVLISLPFKLLLFVLVDGWQLVAGSLLMSVVQPPELVPESMTAMSQLMPFASDYWRSVLAVIATTHGAPSSV